MPEPGGDEVLRCLQHSVREERGPLDIHFIEKNDKYSD